MKFVLDGEAHVAKIRNRKYNDEKLQDVQSLAMGRRVTYVS